MWLTDISMSVLHHNHQKLLKRIYSKNTYRGLFHYLQYIHQNKLNQEYKLMHISKKNCGQDDSISLLYHKLRSPFLVKIDKR